MKQILVEKGVPVAFAAVAVGALAVWLLSFNRDPGVKDRPLGVELAERAERNQAQPAPQPPALPAPTQAAALPALPVEELPGSWPQFRGPNADNASPEKLPLLDSFPPSGPPVLWSVELGEGYASAAVHKGRVFVLDYDSAAQADVLRCFSLANGQELWRRGYPVAVKRNHGMSRTVPAVDDRYVVTLGPKCHLMCCDPVTGKELWRKDLVAEFGVEVPQWYAGQCPIIDGGKAVVGTGGKALLAAFDLATGKVLWQTPNPKGWKMTHSSIARAEFDGRPIYIWCGSGGVVGVSAKDGRVLWETEEWKVSTATVPTPVPIGDGRVFLCGGYDSGAMMIKMERGAPKVLYRLASKEFGSDQQTPILYKGHLYGVTPDRKLTCLSLDGKVLWKSDPTTNFGLGPYMIADGKIFLVDDKGTLTVARAVPTGYKPLAQAKILQGPDAWGPIALAGGRMICRDYKRMVCLDVAKK